MNGRWIGSDIVRLNESFIISQLNMQIKHRTQGLLQLLLQCSVILPHSENPIWD